MNKKITKPVHSVIEHDEYFYRHPETNLDDELSDADEFDPNDDNEKNV